MVLDGPFRPVPAALSPPGGGAASDVVSDAWWPPRSGLPRLLFLARLRAARTAAVSSQLDAHGVATLLGADLFPLDLLHQSLSDRYRDTLEIRRRLLLAGDSVRGQAFTLTLDRLRCAPNDRGSSNVDLWMHGGCKELVWLVDAINDAVGRQGLPRGGGHTPHITVSYTFKGGMPPLQRIPVIDVPIDAFELVAGGGKPYGYTTLRRWMLAPASQRTVQPPLF
jgi:RNA 2',3'-cyclic 3'-phosphodiesterase